MLRPISAPPRPARPGEGVEVGKLFDGREASRPEARNTRHIAVLVVVAELAVVLFALHLFRIEENFGFPKILPLIFIGFVVHAFLPLRWRPPFFLFLSLAAIGGVLGFTYGASLIALGLLLVATCHLPVRFGLRVSLLVGIGVLLSAVRLEWIPSPLAELPVLVLPILGSMFMFRLIVYMYDLRHEQGAVSIWQRLSYFFLLPNVCFLLFPVVDYQRFRSTYYNSSANTIYQKGIDWMVRGLVQLLLYRVVYYFFVPSPAEIDGLGKVVQAMSSTYLLYLRISGQFHLIIGILCLFGFNLPETHRSYLLASGFNDYWRRINIYWKDFMMKIFYYPSLMSMRKRGANVAMVSATLVVFVATWLLHSYQWLWLRGAFPITWPDILFWGIIGTLVIANSLLQSRRANRRIAARSAWSVQSATLHAAKVTAMIVVVTVLWSLWSSASVGQWMEMVMRARAGLGEVMLLAGALGAMVVVGVAVQYLHHRGWSLYPLGDMPSFRRSLVVSGGTAAALVMVGQPSISSRLGAGPAAAIASLQDTRLNSRDAEVLERGYYEGLLDSDKLTSALWRVSPQRQPGDWLGVREAGAVEWTHDLLEFRLIPSFEVTILRIPFRTNQWGMRDLPYTLEKPAGTYRIALLGASHAMGAGVAEEETFQSLTEERLNREFTDGAVRHFEILNFAVAGYTAHQSAIQALNVVPKFRPDAIFFTAHFNEGTRLIRRLAIAVNAGHPIPYPELRAIVEESGATAEMSRDEVERRLSQVRRKLLGWSFRTIADVAHELGAIPVWIYIPAVEEDDTRAPKSLVTLATEAGFTVWDLGNTYADRDPEQLRLASWDTHPNAAGHMLLADRLYEEIRAHRALLFGMQQIRQTSSPDFSASERLPDTSRLPPQRQAR